MIGSDQSQREERGEGGKEGRKRERKRKRKRKRERQKRRYQFDVRIEWSVTLLSASVCV